MSARVFVSYSHDSEDHRAVVLELVQALRAREGIDARIDQFVAGAPEQGWQAWMKEEIEAASYVLVVCTARYRHLFEQGPSEAGSGRGVDWEAFLVNLMMYDDRRLRTKFIPVMLGEATLEDIPLILRAGGAYAWPRDRARLVHHLLAVAVEPVPLGARGNPEGITAQPPGSTMPAERSTTSAALSEAPNTHRTGSGAGAAAAPVGPPLSIDGAASAAVELLAAASAPRARPSGPGPGVVRVLHLSDLHASARSEWDAAPLRARLVERIAALTDAGLGPDLVAFTGDLASTGTAEEYALVERWLTQGVLRAARLGADALLVVPGNHDVDRSRCTALAVRALEDVLRTGEQDAIAEVLRSRSQLASLDERYHAFVACLKRLQVPHARAPRWSLELTVRGTALHVAGLDTAWLASREPTQGQLALGLAQVNALLPARRTDRLVLALAHHPLLWLVDRDRQAVSPPLRARVDVLLRGHLHDPDLGLFASPHHTLLELPAGSLYAGSAWPNSFQLLELDLDQRELRAHVHVWSAAHDAWVLDRTRFAPDGVARFPLARPQPAW